MLFLLETGRSIGVRRLAADPEGARLGVGTVDAAVFAMLGLLVAFTFSGAAMRFDNRRQLIVEEANDIGTAYLRINILPASSQPALKELFRRYLDTRLAVYQKLPDIKAAKEELKVSAKLQNEIWNYAVNACKESGASHTHMLLLPALNAMFDITTTRTSAMRMHPPAIVYAMLGVVALASSLLAGYGMAGGKSRSWIHIFCFAAIVAMTVYVILDIEHPRFGLFRVDTSDQVLIAVRESMK